MPFACVCSSGVIWEEKKRKRYRALKLKQSVVIAFACVCSSGVIWEEKKRKRYRALKLKQSVVIALCLCL